MQTKLESVIETILNVLSGLLLSIFVVQPIIFPWFNIHTTVTENTIIAVIFTVVSILRGYLWRRYFNKRTMRRLKDLYD